VKGDGGGGIVDKVRHKHNSDEIGHVGGIHMPISVCEMLVLQEFKLCRYFLYDTESSRCVLLKDCDSKVRLHLSSFPEFLCI
jgi:hypothetical protein